MDTVELKPEYDDSKPRVSNVSVGFPGRWAWESSLGQFYVYMLGK